MMWNRFCATILFLARNLSRNRKWFRAHPRESMRNSSSLRAHFVPSTRLVSRERPPRPCEEGTALLSPVLSWQKISAIHLSSSTHCTVQSKKVHKSHALVVRTLHYRVTHQVVANLPLTSWQKLCFGLGRLGQDRPKRNCCFNVNGRFPTTWCFTLYCTCTLQNILENMKSLQWMNIICSLSHCRVRLKCSSVT